MYKLGFYSVDSRFSNIRIYPLLVDRILEVISVLAFLALWGCAAWLCWQIEDKNVIKSVLILAGVGSVCQVILVVGAYVPLQKIKFPFRINEYNVYKQFFLAKRIYRVLGVFCPILFIIQLFSKEVLKNAAFLGGSNVIANAISIVLFVLPFLVYYILAFRYR